MRQLRAAYARGARAPVLVLPTGGGKTVIFSYIVKCAAEKGTRAQILVHRRELVDQVSAALSAWGVPHGRVTPQDRPTDDPVQVAMVQTLARRVALDQAGRYRFDLVVIDEAHHAVQANTWGQVLAHNAGARLLGVTATPCRLDGKGLGQDAGGWFDAMVVGPSVQELIDRGRLARPVVYVATQAADVSGVRSRGGDFVQKELEAAVGKTVYAEQAERDYRRLLAGAPTIVFAVSVPHAELVAGVFRAAGWQAGVLSGKTPDRERAEMIRDLGAGRLQVLCSCNVVSEGTDIPAVVGAILLRPTQSLALARQQMGRALRVAPGKDRAIILDHAGNVWRHGLPEEPVEWSLKGARRRSGEAPTKLCRDCGATVALGAATCPACGAVLVEYAGPEHEPEDIEDQAEIVELREASPELYRSLMRRRREENRRARSLWELVELGRRRGYVRPEAWAGREWARQKN